MPTYAEIDAALTSPAQLFEIDEIEIRGVPTRVWKHTPRSLRVVLEQSRSQGGDTPFLVLGAERVTHSEHHARVAAFARRLVDDFGVSPGDRVVIAMRNYPEWSVAFFAAVAIGAVAVPLNAWWTGEELAFGIADSGARVVVADGARLARLADEVDELSLDALVGVRLDDRPDGAALPAGIVTMESAGAPLGALPEIAIAPDDDATIFYTSGTTGRPKGVLGTHRNICSNLVSLMYVGARSRMRAGIAADAPVAPTSPPVLLVPVPLFHATGCHSILVAQAYFGGTLVLMRKWDPATAVELIERERVTSLSGVPAMVWELLDAPNLGEHDISSLASLGGGGAAAPSEIVRKAERLLPGRAMSTGYGLTETSSLVTSNSGADYARRPDRVGVPVPVCRLRIVDDLGIDVALGDPGEVWINGPNVVKGYWHRPEETAETFVDGWVHSGDIGRIDDEGFLSIVDRAKDIIIRGGENVASAEVEAALFEHPAVADAAAIAVPHPVLGEEVGVVVCVRPGTTVTADELREHVAQRLAAFKVPAHIYFRTEALPRNPAGKVLKRELREQVTGS
jgi:long-chain acyl-CoA synthetase